MKEFTSFGIIKCFVSLGSWCFHSYFTQYMCLPCYFVESESDTTTVTDVVDPVNASIQGLYSFY